MPVSREGLNPAKPLRPKRVQAVESLSKGQSRPDFPSRLPKLFYKGGEELQITPEALHVPALSDPMVPRLRPKSQFGIKNEKQAMSTLDVNKFPECMF